MKKVLIYFWLYFVLRSPVTRPMFVIREEVDHRLVSFLWKPLGRSYKHATSDMIIYQHSAAPCLRDLE